MTLLSWRVAHPGHDFVPPPKVGIWQRLETFMIATVQEEGTTGIYG